MCPLSIIWNNKSLMIRETNVKRNAEDDIIIFPPPAMSQADAEHPFDECRESL